MKFSVHRDLSHKGIGGFRDPTFVSGLVYGLLTVDVISSGCYEQSQYRYVRNSSYVLSSRNHNFNTQNGWRFLMKVLFPFCSVNFSISH